MPLCLHQSHCRRVGELHCAMDLLGQSIDSIGVVGARELEEESPGRAISTEACINVSTYFSSTRRVSVRVPKLFPLGALLLLLLRVETVRPGRSWDGVGTALGSGKGEASTSSNRLCLCIMIFSAFSCS